MFKPQHDFFLALAAARRATRRDNLSDADKWLKIAERHQRLAAEMIRLAEAEATLRTYREEQVAFRKWLRREEAADAPADSHTAS